MGIDKRKIYRKRNPVKIALKVIGIILAALVLLFIILFFALQKYIVYTPEGIKLDIPYLQQYNK